MSTDGYTHDCGGSCHDPNCPTCIDEADHQCKSCGALVEWPDGESSDFCQGCAALGQSTPSEAPSRGAKAVIAPKTRALVEAMSGSQGAQKPRSMMVGNVRVYDHGGVWLSRLACVAGRPPSDRACRHCYQDEARVSEGGPS
jgi:hypothetical protein